MGLTRYPPDELQIVLGHKSPCKKALTYDTEFPKINLHTTRDPILHDKRKVWDQGLLPKSLREYQARIMSFAEL